MKKKIVFLLFVVGIAAFLYLRSEGSTMKAELSDFSVKDTASIEKIFLANKMGAKVELVRGDKYWRVNGKYNARTDMMAHLLETIHRIKVMAPVSKKKFETIVKKLAGRGVKVEIYMGDDKPEKVYYVGKSNQEYSGTYMLLEGSSVPFLMHLEGFRGYLTPRYMPHENEWRDRSIFKLNPQEIRTLTVTDHKNDSNSFRIELIGGEDILLKNSNNELLTTNGNKVANYLTLFDNINFEGFEETRTPEYIDSIKIKNLLHTYVIEDIAGNSSKILTYMKPAVSGSNDAEGNPFPHDMDRLYVLVNDVDFVIGQYRTFRPITKSLFDLTD